MARRKVLLIESDPVRKIDRQKALKKLGYKTVLTASGSAALRSLRGTVIDAAVIDLELQDMPGVHLLREMRRQGIDVPVILTGRNPSKDELIMALRGRANDFLERPFDDEDLSMALTRALFEPEVLWTPPRRLDLANLSRAVSENRFGWEAPHDLALGLERLPQNPQNALRSLVEQLRGHRDLQDALLAELNGPRFNPVKPIETLREAVSANGPRLVGYLAAERALEPLYILEDVDDLHADVAWGMWECARMTGHLCHELARKLGLWDSEGLALSGLVHNLGEVLVVRYEASLDKGRILGKEEQILKDLDERVAECHEAVGVVAARLWGASDELAALVGSHHRSLGSDAAPQDRLRQGLVLACWETAVRWGLSYFPSHDLIDPRPSLRALELEPKVAKAAADGARAWLLPIED